MRSRFVEGWPLAFAALVAFLALAVTPLAGQASRGATYRAPRTFDGKPDLSGIWQVLNTASWDIQAHNAADGRKLFMGSSGTGAPGDAK